MLLTDPPLGLPTDVGLLELDPQLRLVSGDWHQFTDYEGMNSVVYWDT